MRKFISLGLLALLLSIFASPVMAGGAAECDGLKEDETAPRGLYGLCTAYYSAENGRGQERVEQLYAKKAIAAGYPPEIPRLELPQEPDPPEVACPCWPDDEITNANGYGAPAEECQIESPTELAIYGFGPPEAPVVTFHIEPGLCIYLGPDAIRFLPVGSEEELTCRAGIQVLVDMDFGGSCL